ncbi:MAG: hypothetical protein RLY78_158 [Pseudomonadota bacterium]
MDAMTTLLAIAAGWPAVLAVIVVIRTWREPSDLPADVLAHRLAVRRWRRGQGQSARTAGEARRPA